MKGMLVKWDAAALEAQMPAWKRAVRRTARLFGADVFSPTPSAADILNPTANPACLEVVDLVDGRDPQTLYRRA